MKIIKIVYDKHESPLADDDVWNYVESIMIRVKNDETQEFYVSNLLVILAIQKYVIENNSDEFEVYISDGINEILCNTDMTYDHTKINIPWYGTNYCRDIILGGLNLRKKTREFNTSELNNNEGK